MNDYRPPSRDLIPEEIEIYQAVLGQTGVNTIGQAAILLYSNPQFQIPVYEMYVKKGIENLWIRIQSNIFICQGFISVWSHSSFILKYMLSEKNTKQREISIQYSLIIEE